MNLKSPTQYYWCVNCGHYGNFNKVRIFKLQCEKCNYDELTKFELQEIQESEELIYKFRNVLSENSSVPGLEHDLHGLVDV